MELLTRRLTPTDVLALEARRIYGAEDDERRKAVTRGTARRGSVQW